MTLLVPSSLTCGVWPRLRPPFGPIFAAERWGLDDERGWKGLFCGSGLGITSSNLYSINCHDPSPVPEELVQSFKDGNRSGIGADSIHLVVHGRLA